jgi:hypothetical protein|tara:strand:+ start:657 stop:776 length:120 start_codon:yes stop_codon:yes gene_type:complete
MYLETLDHLPSMGAMKHLIPEWSDRETTKTGTRLDDLYS